MTYYRFIQPNWDVSVVKMGVDTFVPHFATEVWMGSRECGMIVKVHFGVRQEQNVSGPKDFDNPSSGIAM